ncbi:MAG TPA: hypothetical protein PLC99_14930 [Verrucomicrobiota bacterium]|nr:hypothetical protein [Verrucomicrobiota bacterium]
MQMLNIFVLVAVMALLHTPVAAHAATNDSGTNAFLEVFIPAARRHWTFHYCSESPESVHREGAAAGIPQAQYYYAVQLLTQTQGNRESCLAYERVLKMQENMSLAEEREEYPDSFMLEMKRSFYEGRLGYLNPRDPQYTVVEGQLRQIKEKLKRREITSDAGRAKVRRCSESEKDAVAMLRGAAAKTNAPAMLLLADVVSSRVGHHSARLQDSRYATELIEAANKRLGELTGLAARTNVAAMLALADLDEALAAAVRVGWRFPGISTNAPTGPSVGFYDRGQAYSYCSTAAQLGSSEAMARLGYYYADDARKDLPSAVKWFEKGFKAGDLLCAYRLATILADGGLPTTSKGYPRDPFRAYSIGIALQAVRREKLSYKWGAEIVQKTRGEVPPERLKEAENVAARCLMGPRGHSLGKAK